MNNLLNLTSIKQIFNSLGVKPKILDRRFLKETPIKDLWSNDQHVDHDRNDPSQFGLVGTHVAV